MVDDNPDVGPDHFNFNDSLAAQGYSVKINAGDGFNTTLASADIARNNGYIVVNKLNGTDLPLLTPGGKRSYPLHLKGSAVFGGQQVGNITSIELTGMPQPTPGWTLTMEGDVIDVITQQYFEQAIVCHHNVTYTDSSGQVWTGVPLWDLVGSVDDIETSAHWTFNDTRANVTGYTVRVIAGDGYNKTFSSLGVSHNNGYIIANTLNGTALSGSNGHLKLVGPATTSGGQRVGNITKISLEGLPAYPAGSYNLSLKGKISDIIPQPELEEWIAHHNAVYTDGSGNVYEGIPLWRLMGWVDDRIPHGSDGFDDAAAVAGYKVIVKAGDGYAKEFTSGSIGKNDNYIIANTLNGSALPTTGSNPPWPLRLVGASVSGSNSVGKIAEIELTDFQIPSIATPLHIMKYGPDGVTVINETNVTYQWMEQNLAVIGDGTTIYKFEGLTLNSSNLWDPEETYPGGYKISNAVKGTRIHDLCELVGGMGSGTTITFVASDGFETTLPYSSIYTNPAVQARQGDAILAWWGDGQYVPAYGDGMRLFFMPSDHVYGQWDMHETLPSQFWRYNYQDNVLYPSCAGLSAKYITTIRVLSSPESDWSLQLNGLDIGGLNSTVSKPYFEEALACQFGANHSTTFTDSSGRIWEGIPLWFLCGFVDDADLHSPNSYNETKALAGYNITITGTDGYNYTFDSRSTIRNSNYIVANSLNGTHINSTDSSWPLRLVGTNVTGSKIVKKIASIKLTPISSLNQPMTKIGIFRNGFWIIDYNGNFQWDGTGQGNDIVAGFGQSGDNPVVGNWNHTLSGDKIGVFRNGSWLLDYNGNFLWDGNDKVASLGATGDLPAVGDWNNNGDTKIGVFRNGFWILDYNGNFQWDGPEAGGDIVAGFGMTGDIPVVADWGGTHQDKIGVFRNGFWILDYNGNFQWDGLEAGGDIVAGFGGMAGDVPVAKDWNGDGLPEMGVFHPGVGQWVIDYNRNFQWDDTSGGDVVISLGEDGDIAVGGNWDSKTNNDKAGVFRNGFWILDYDGNNRWDGAPPDKVVGFGMAGDLPVQAEFE
jgi:DMSO/TMAO reductase YedYZ molybdopterin-dependent catalytic subunit